MNVVPDLGSLRGRVILLAPPGTQHLAGRFSCVSEDAGEYDRLLRGLQKLRGQLYLADGAIHEWQLSPDGRHAQSADDSSWHLVAMRPGGEVFGCSRYTPHAGASFSHLSIRRSPLALSDEWGLVFRNAVESDLALAESRGIDYVEVGGWALAPEYRCSAEALRIALATYSLARILGGCIGIGTVTRRHCSSSILRRIGGRPLSCQGIDLPRYFDAQYGCEMEVLRFDSSQPNPRFEPWVSDLGRYLQCAPVIYRGRSAVRPSAIPADRISGLREASDLQPGLLQAV